ncbi:MAG: acyl carrier protein phosphodiesterase [Bryobacterales bacterium]|nr:acyl carrier protein phosphodiesterase [Bryobacterales bacterium]
MATLLQLDSSPSPNSVSRELTHQFAQTWKTAHRDGDVIYRDLAANPPEPIDALWIGAAYTPPSSRTAEQTKTLAFSEELIGELERADEYVFGVAMHNFSIPAVLKLWIDQVVRSGRTFSYGEQGPQGLLKGKKATVVVASGGVYGLGTPAAGMNHVDSYLKTILAFVGLTDVKFINAGGSAGLMTGAVDRQTFLRPVLEQVRAAAA